jgi:hypothetical protein
MVSSSGIILALGTGISVCFGFDSSDFVHDTVSKISREIIKKGDFILIVVKINELKETKITGIIHPIRRELLIPASLLLKYKQNR